MEIKEIERYTKSLYMFLIHVTYYSLYEYYERGGRVVDHPDYRGAGYHSCA